MKSLVFTCGDINGIGPELAIKTFNRIFNPAKRNLIFVVPRNLFEKSADGIEPHFDFEIVKKIPERFPPKVLLLDTGRFKQNTGIPTVDSGRASFKSIVESIELLKAGKAQGVITLPISKESFKLAGIRFRGHTELLAEKTNSKKFMMLFLSKKFKCGLATIHVPLKNVAAMITKNRITDSLELLNETLQKDLGIEEPRIAVLGLNPHAGEGGIIGNEEKNIIAPAARRYNAYGPFVPDAFFALKLFEKYDAVLGMYHDQVLIPFKMLNFNRGVNYTAGLPIVRTSPDHGTGFDIAGKKIADPSSTIEAVKWAEFIIGNRIKNAGR